MQRKAIVCCMTLTQLHSKKEREAIQYVDPLHSDSGEKTSTPICGCDTNLNSTPDACVFRIIYIIFSNLQITFFSICISISIYSKHFIQNRTRSITKFSSTLSWRPVNAQLLSNSTSDDFNWSSLHQKALNIYSRHLLRLLSSTRPYQAQFHQRVRNFFVVVCVPSSTRTAAPRGSHTATSAPEQSWESLLFGQSQPCFSSEECFSFQLENVRRM